jgi:hypothetical protein
MQTSQLQHDTEQETTAGKDPAKKILQILPQTHFT